MNSDPETRHSLIAQLASGDDWEAWTEFQRLYQPVIFNYARRNGLQDADAHDVVQLVLTRVARKASNWDPGRSQGSFRGWLATTVRNLVIDHFRAKKRRPDTIQVMPELVVDSAADTAVFDLEERRSLFHWAAQRVRQEFQASTWEAFWQTAVQQRSVPQVSAELHLSPGAVYVARSRVLARIRHLVTHNEFDSREEGYPRADH